MTKDVDFSEIYKNLSLQPLEGEVFKVIDGYDGFYEVSNYGRVLANARKSLVKNGYFKVSNPKILRQRLSVAGYPTLTLSLNDKPNGFVVHRLVAKAFIPNPFNKPEVNHLDGVKSNNNVENLEWATPVENMEHAFRTGLVKTRCNGEENHLSKLKRSDVIEIKKLISVGKSCNSIAILFKMNRNTILKIKKGITWSRVSIDDNTSSTSAF